MILSHNHKFIFFKTRKTGGTSFEIALSKYALPGDVVTPVAPDDEKIRAALGHGGPQNHLAEDGRGMKFHNHIEASEIRQKLPAAVFDGYVKVSIVRNPFDLAVSWYYWERSRMAETSREDFRDWLRYQHRERSALEAEYRMRRRPNPGVLASNRLITHIDGQSAVDVMIRYEHLDEDLVRFAARTGLPASLIHEFGAIRAKGSYRPRSATTLTMFDGFAEGQEIIRTAFAEDIDAYRYVLA